MLNIGIVGATGYTGAVLMSLLLTHPDAKIKLITSNTYRGRKISDIFPLFRGRLEEVLTAEHLAATFGLALEVERHGDRWSARALG